MQLAYLDAGSGSLIASAVVGGAAAAGVALRSARSRITGALSRKRRTEGDGDGADVTAEAGAAETVDAAASDRPDAVGADGVETDAIAGDADGSGGSSASA